MADRQGRRISQLVRTMVHHLNRYQGSQTSRRRDYVKFRDAKRELYGMRPDLAKNVMKLVSSQTHWGGHYERGNARERKYIQRETGDDSFDVSSFDDHQAHSDYDYDDDESFFEEYDSEEDYDIDYWEAINEELQDYNSGAFSMFEKFS